MLSLARIGSILALLVLATQDSAAVTIGKAPGFAAGTTGGGNATPVYPKDIKELKALLADAQPRVIYLNKLYDYRNSEGKKTEKGCRPKNNRDCIAKNNGHKGQDVILMAGDTTMTKTGGCSEGVAVSITYDLAPKTPLVVGSNKTLRGIGQTGAIKGKGLVFRGDNVIIQNIEVSELNPHLVWGGDALTMAGKQVSGKSVPLEKIWLDHLRIANVGRQMVVVNFGGAKSVAITNSEFDGRTQYSASCDGRHYWTFLLHGDTTQISLLGNYIHHTSGRGPKITSTTNPAIVHAANNYWGDNSGHSFAVTDKGVALLEGNYFESTATPSQAATTGSVFVPSSTNQALCKANLGRNCVANTLVSSGVLASRGDSTVMSNMKAFAQVKSTVPTAAQKLSKRTTNFGIGSLA